MKTRFFFLSSALTALKTSPLFRALSVMALLLSSSVMALQAPFNFRSLPLYILVYRIKAMSKTTGIIRLNAIDDKTRTKTVAVRILRLWVQKDLSGKEGLKMIILDEWGDKIQASISAGLKRKFIPLLKEGNMILIKKFQVLENKPNFQSAKIKHEKRIGFGLATKVLQSVECLQIAENGFNFISFRDICKHDTSLVLDVLGEVKTRNISIESVEMRNGKAAKCDIKLVDADGTQLTCVLWESFANQLKLFMDNMSASDTEPVIVALQFAMISNYRAVIKVSTMKHTSRFFIRPDIQEVKDFILRRGVSGATSNHSISDISNGARDLNSEEWLNAGSLRTINEIINSDATGDSNGTPDIMSTMLDRECLFKVEVTVRFGDRVYTVKNVTEDAEMMAQFSSISYAKDHVAVIEETSSSSTMSEITPQKRSRDSDLSHIDSDGGDLQFSSTRVLKK